MAPPQTKKILTVVGATGRQGGSVIAAVLSHPHLSTEYSIRALTRNASTAKLPAGVEVVEGDLNSPASLENAFKGSAAVFGMTDYWALLDRDAETAQGKRIADAAKAAGVRHLIWSSSTDVTKVTAGEITDAFYFDSKAAVEAYIESIKGDDMAATYVVPGVFMHNFINEVRRTPSGDGKLIWPKPWILDQTLVPLIDAADSGVYVAGILSQPDTSAVNGTRILGVSQWLTPAAMLSTIKRATGIEIEFVAVSAEEYQKALPQKIARELTANMVWMRDYGFFGPGAEDRQAESDWVLGEMKMKSWEEYVEQNGPWKW